MITKSHGFVLLAALGMSFILIHSTFLKNFGVSSLEQVLFRMSISLPLLFLIFRGEKLFSIKKSDVLFFLSIGLVFSVFLFSALSSLVFGATIAVAVALICTQPIFTALISIIIGKEKIRMAKVLLIFIGTVGAFIATGLTLSDIVNLNINLGIAFALSSGLFYALYLSLKRVAKKRKYSSGQITFNTFLFAIPWVAFIGVLLRNFSDNPLFVGLVVPNLYQWLLLFSFAIFSTILPYASLNFVNPKEIDPTTEGLLLLLDPVLHNLWAVVFFQQLVSPLQYMGVFLVLLVAAVNLKIL